MKLNLLRLFLVTGHFTGLLSSPLAQYDYEDYEYNEDYDYEEIITPFDFCFLPPELDYNGKVKPIFECDTLHRFENPPCEIGKYHGNFIDVCCPMPESICLPGYACDRNTWTKLCETNVAGIETCQLCNKTSYDLGKRECHAEATYSCPSNDYVLGGDSYDYYFDEKPISASDRCDKVGNKCLPMSQCNLQNLSNSDEPPISCGFSDQTGEDHFCCAEKSSAESNNGNNIVPQPPLFNQSGQAWPCVDHTEMCPKWIKGCDPEHESYEFMKFACMETCGICKNEGCVDTFKNCPKWAKKGDCSRYPNMMIHCKESCGTCGFRSVFNKEPQRVGTKQYTDLDSEDFECGKSKSNFIYGDGKTYLDASTGSCTSIRISDRFVLAAAQCMEPLERSEDITAIEIRKGTDYREAFAVRRFFLHPLKEGAFLQYYYDFAILELDRKILFDYEIYGDSPICLNDKFDISNKEATIQGFGALDNSHNSYNYEGNLKQAKVVTVSNENCTKWVQANAEELETFTKLPYGNGFTFNELPNGINREILCSRGILQEDGSISGPCAGDSGGPLYINEKINEKNEITGRTLAGLWTGSGVTNCGKLDIYSYWIRVSEHLPWIKCIKKNAEENKTTTEVEKACEKFVKKFDRKCEKDENGSDIQNSCKQCEKIGSEEEVCNEEE